MRDGVAGDEIIAVVVSSPHAGGWDRLVNWVPHPSVFEGSGF